MIKAFPLAATGVLIAGVVNADTDSFKARVDGLLDQVAGAAYSERLIPFLMRYEDPRLTRTIASNFGVEVATFQGQVIAGYLNAAERTDVESIDIFRDQITYGETTEGPWAVVSYSIRIVLLPDERLPATCNRLIFHEADGEVFVSMIGTPQNENFLKQAIPELSEAVDLTEAHCAGGFS